MSTHNPHNIPDLDDRPDALAGQCNQTESIPYPTEVIGGHLFDDGEIRILKLLIAQHRQDVLTEYHELQLDKMTAQFEFDELINACGDR